MSAFMISPVGGRAPELIKSVRSHVAKYVAASTLGNRRLVSGQEHAKETDKLIHQ